MELGIRNKYAIITGGSHGIGRAIALALADEGCNIAVCARNKERIEKIIREIEAKSVAAIGISADITSLADIERVMKTVIDSWGTIHILVNNAGGGGRWGSNKVEETSEDIWVDVYNKNALAAIRFTMKVIPYMRKQKWGRVVTITSTYGREGGGRPWFNMAKTAQTALMKNLAQFPLGRLGTPVEVANVVAFMCSERAVLVNGACITVDGGESRSF